MRYATIRLTNRQAQILHGAIMYHFAGDNEDLQATLGGRRDGNTLKDIEVKLNAACQAAFGWQFACR